jgi:hypothetical protein
MTKAFMSSADDDVFRRLGEADKHDFVAKARIKTAAPPSRGQARYTRDERLKDAVHANLC